MKITYTIYRHRAELSVLGTLEENKEYYLHPERLPGIIAWAKDYEGRCGGGIIEDCFFSLNEAEEAFSKIAAPVFDKYSFENINGTIMYLTWFSLEKEEWDDDCIDGCEVLAERLPIIE